MSKSKHSWLLHGEGQVGVVGTDAAILFHCLNFSFSQLPSFSEFRLVQTSFLRVYL